MKPCTAIFILISLTPILGCTSPPRPMAPVEPPPAHTPPLSISSKQIDTQIQALEASIAKQELTREKKELARYLLSTYRDLKKLSHDQHLTIETYDLLVQTLFETLVSTQQAVFKPTTSPPVPSSDLRDFFEMKQDIIRAYLKGNDPYVIHACRLLISTYGAEHLTPEIAAIYAVALAREGALTEAMAQGRSALRQMDQRPDSITLRTKMVQWALRLGRNDQARDLYEGLCDMQDKKTDAISDVKTALQTGETPSPPREPVPTQTERKPDLTTFTDLDNLLNAVDALLEKNRFKDAKLLLIRHRLTFEDPRQIDAIDQKIQTIATLEQEYEAERMIREAYIKETLEGAKRLMEAEEFEAAMDKLNDIEGDEAITAQSKALRERVVENIINQERNRAAKLFLEAGRTQDPSKKEQLLQTSYGILKALVDKYPASPLKDKVLSHIGTVKEALVKVRER